jgi:hypothetical protein
MIQEFRTVLKSLYYKDNVEVSPTKFTKIRTVSPGSGHKPPNFQT